MARATHTNCENKKTFSERSYAHCSMYIYMRACTGLFALRARCDKNGRRASALSHLERPDDIYICRSIDISHYTYMSIHNVTRTTHTYTQKHIHVIVTRTSNKTNPETQARTWEIVYMMASIARLYIGAVSPTKRCLSLTLQTRSVCSRSKLCGITPRLTVQFPGSEADKERCARCELGHHGKFVLPAGYTQMPTWHLVHKKMGEHWLKASIFEPYPELGRGDGPDDCK